MLWIIPQLIIWGEILSYQGQRLDVPIFDVTQLFSLKVSITQMFFGKIFSINLNLLAIVYLYIYVKRFRKSYLGLSFHSTSINETEIPLEQEIIQGKIIEYLSFEDYPNSYIIQLKDSITYQEIDYPYIIISDFNNDRMGTEMELTFNSNLLKNWDPKIGTRKKDLRHIGIIEGTISKQLIHQLNTL
ncbi:hypothetical protein [Flammeovirga pacifica]|uniref:hypothetical protein n=1 Tax=Flammeovirga pacifica TaxID=915059 RepID=UPI001114BBE2|nr:hypothetical protein [Flammeovirga pacifica]